MNTNFKFIRFAFALMIALGAIGFSASAALAAPPDNYSYTFIYPYSDSTTCSFNIDVTSIGTVHETDFYNNNGVLTKSKMHFDAQDTYTAKTVTLIGDWFHFTATFQFDSNGKVISDWADGVVEKIPLPSGGLLFISAGRVNFLNHPGPVISADIGNPGDVAAFCAAFAP